MNYKWTVISLNFIHYSYYCNARFFPSPFITLQLSHNSLNSEPSREEDPQLCSHQSIKKIIKEKNLLSAKHSSLGAEQAGTWNPCHCGAYILVGKDSQ